MTPEIAHSIRQSKETVAPPFTPLLLPGKKETFLGARLEEEMLPLALTLGKYALLFSTQERKIYHFDRLGNITERQEGKDILLGTVRIGDNMGKTLFLAKNQPVTLQLYHNKIYRPVTFPSKSPVEEIILYDITQPNPPELSQTNLYSLLLRQYLKK